MPRTDGRPDDGAGRPEYYTTAQLARVILYMSGYLPLEPPEDVHDCIAWAAALIEKERKDTL